MISSILAILERQFFCANFSLFHASIMSQTVTYILDPKVYGEPNNADHETFEIKLMTLYIPLANSKYSLF